MVEIDDYQFHTCFYTLKFFTLHKRMSHHYCPDLSACTREGDRWILNSVSDWTRKQFVCKCRKGLTQCVVMLVTGQFKTISWWRQCRGQTFRPEAFRKTSTTNLTDSFCFVWIYLLDGLSWMICLERFFGKLALRVQIIRGSQNVPIP